MTGARHGLALPFGSALPVRSTVAVLGALGLLGTAVLGLAPAEIAAQQPTAAEPVDPLSVPRPELRALRIDVPIELDGVLDEEPWGRADATDPDWIQIAPDAGFPGTEATVVRVLYDDDALYFGADLYDPDPEAAISAGLDPDYDTASSDLLGVALDTFHDRANGFVFAVNPAGAVFDAQAFNDQRDVSRAWEGIVEVRTRAWDDRWTVEMKIPLSTLRYDASRGEQVWGLNFSRRIRRRNEDTYWAALPRQFRVYKFSLAGTLTGLEGLAGGRNLWVKPAALVTNRAGRAVLDPGTEGDLGLDVKWGLTPGLTLDVTLNTDFSQVEVDQEQVNLDRFSLFFPELRDFFLENEGVFGFQDVQIRNYRMGSSNRSFRLFNSRRIGLGPDRRPVPILGGARLTGRAAGLEVGFLGMRTRAVDPVEDGAVGLPAENFAVGRVKAPIGERGSVGAMWVQRSESASEQDYTDRAYGVDANLQFLGNLVVNAYAARTSTGDDGSADEGAGAAAGAETASPPGNRDAGMLQLAWRDPLWNTSVLLKHVGDAFDPAVGFVDRRDVRRLFATFGAHPRPSGIPGVLEVNPYVDVDFYTNLDGVQETRTLTPGLQLTTRDGGSIVLEVRDRYERVLEPFRIAGSEVPVGAFDFTEWSARYTVPASHVLSGRFSLTRGGFYDGDRTSIGIDLLFRPNPHWQISAGAQRNELDFGGRAFTANLYDARVRYAHDTRTFASLFTQYDEADDELVVNARFNLIHAPLSDLFVVFTERRRLSTDLDAGIGKGRIERGITLKLTRLLAF